MAAWSIIIILCVATIVLLNHWKSFHTSVKRRRMLNKLPCVPEPKYPLIGHSLLFRGDTADFFKNITEGAARVICEWEKKVVNLWLGPIPLVIVLHPDSVEPILRSSKHMEKSFLYRFLHPWLGTGLLTSGGEKWRQRRRLITPAFHFDILQDFLAVMNEQGRKMMSLLEKKYKPGEKVDLGKIVTLCALDIICETAMGRTVNAQQNKDSDYVRSIYKISDIIQSRQKAPWLWWDFLFNKMKRGIEQDRLLKLLHKFTRSVIEERIQEVNKKAIKKRMAFLDVLINARTVDGEKLSIADIQEEVDTFMFEGHDTTAAAMTWCLFLLGHHPEIQQQVHNELDSVFTNDRSVTMDDIKNLTYLDQVIKESLRLYPSVPFFARVTTDNCEVNGYEIPEGTQVFVNVYNIHRSPVVWDDPNQFNPDRFNKENCVGRHPYAYIPFSAGPRNCIGQKFASMEEKVVLSYVLRSYHVVSGDDQETLPVDGDLILRPSKPLRFTLQKRSSARDAASF